MKTNDENPEKETKNNDTSIGMGTTFIGVSLIWLILGLTSGNTTYLILAMSFFITGAVFTPWKEVFEKSFIKPDKPEKKNEIEHE